MHAGLHKRAPALLAGAAGCSGTLYLNVYFVSAMHPQCIITWSNQGKRLPALSDAGNSKFDMLVQAVWAVWAAATHAFEGKGVSDSMTFS